MRLAKSFTHRAAATAAVRSRDLRRELDVSRRLLVGGDRGSSRSSSSGGCGGSAPVVSQQLVGRGDMIKRRGEWRRIAIIRTSAAIIARRRRRRRRGMVPVVVVVMVVRGRGRGGGGRRVTPQRWEVPEEDRVAVRRGRGRRRIWRRCAGAVRCAFFARGRGAHSRVRTKRMNPPEATVRSRRLLL